MAPKVVKLGFTPWDGTQEREGKKNYPLFAIVIKRIFITRLNLILKIKLNLIKKLNILSLKTGQISDLQIATEIKVSVLGTLHKNLMWLKYDFELICIKPGFTRKIVQPRLRLKKNVKPGFKEKEKKFS